MTVFSLNLYCETTRWREVGKRLHGRLGQRQIDDGGIVGLDELRVILGLLVRTTLDLLLDVADLAGGVTVEHKRAVRRVVRDLIRVVRDAWQF